MAEKAQTFNPVVAAQAQIKYCEENNAPHFAPYSGNCYHCKKNIYTEVEFKIKNHADGEDYLWRTGISVERAGSELVTGCPHCNRSYCD